MSVTPDDASPSNDNSSENDCLHNELRIVSDSIRFFITLRFATLAFSVTCLAAALAANEFTGGLERPIPIFGTLITATAFIIELRTRRLYLTCIRRGTAIEHELGTGADGLYHKLGKTPAPFDLGFATHTLAVRVLYNLLFAFWIYLVIVGVH